MGRHVGLPLPHEINPQNTAWPLNTIAPRLGWSGWGFWACGVRRGFGRVGCGGVLGEAVRDIVARWPRV
ncbi:MAG: hypothetical protein KDE56_13945 [Anaerolineales bacterium]|nr:hypothetical protein [Anaerolineales bacterium]